MDRQLRDMTDEVVLVTGATSGIGRETARLLGERGATVLVHGRDRERGRTAVEEISEGPGDAALFVADLASLETVRELAGEVRECHDRLDVLVNNAGVFLQERRESPDGHEFSFAVNHLAPYLLTHDLVDELLDSEGRIVTTSSGLHHRGEMEFSDLMFEDGYSGMDAYARSKLANVLFTYELARRLEGTGVTANTLHPGAIPGSRFGRNLSLPMRLAWRALALVPGYTSSPADGAETVAYLAASPEVDDVSGAYFEDCERVDSSPASRDETTQRRLWEISADLVGIDPDWP